MLEVSFNFDDLERVFSEAERAMKELEGPLGSLKFNAADPTDVDRAIKEVERMVEQKLSKYRSNPLIEPYIDATKQAFRNEIIKQATDARNKRGS